MNLALRRLEIETSFVIIVVTSWEAWLAQHPDTQVLDLDTGYERPYEPGAAYGSYFANADTMFPVWQRSDLLDTKSHIYALNIEGIPKAYPVDILSREKVVNDTVGDLPVVLIATRGTVELRKNEEDIDYTAGAEVRAYNRGTETFKPGPDADTVLDASGREWRIMEESLIGPEGKQSPRISGHLAYWFGWYAFFPQTLVYGE